jgi:hypothetical protein
MKTRSKEMRNISIAKETEKDKTGKDQQKEEIKIFIEFSI